MRNERHVSTTRTRITVDGRVEAVFEGEQDAVQRAVDWARLGPERALVTKFEEFTEEPEGLVGFEIRY